MDHAKLITNLLLAAATLSVAKHPATPSQPATRMTVFLAAEGRSRALTTHLRTIRKKAIPYTPTYKVTATAYQAVVGQTDDEPFVTADNSRIKPHYSSKTRWLALSQDLLARWGGKFQYGDKVLVQGVSPQLDGVYTVHDTMNKRHRHCIDILTHTSEKLDIFTPNVELRLELAATPPDTSTRKSRTRATATASARLGQSVRRTEVFKNPPPAQKRVDYFASASL